MKLAQLKEIYYDYKERELDELNETFTDILIIKLEDLLKYLQLISQGSSLGKKLQDKKLFRSDVKVFVSYITPILPFTGLIKGGITISSEVFEHFSNKNNESSDTNRSNISSDTEEGKESD